MNTNNKQNLTLGIDIGLSSIGWALVKDQAKFIDGGVHIFTNGGDEEANKTRREKRLQRRQTRRRSMRIRRLIHILAGTGMLPIATTINLRAQLDKAARLPKKERHAATTSPTTQALKDFFDMVPWTLRKKAIEGEKLTPLELGRVFYHFAHQRGFPKASLRTLEGDKEAQDEAKIIREGSPKDDKIGALYTEKGIKEEKHRYLGYYLANLFPSKGTPPYKMPERIRSRYTYREMYKAEFNHIWQTQKDYHPELLTPKRKAAIDHALFFQLPLQAPPRGQCTFEPNKKRAYLSSIPCEEFRAYQYLNNFLAHYGLTTPETRLPFLEKAVEEFLGRKTGITPTQLAKKLNLKKANEDEDQKQHGEQEKEDKRSEFIFTTQLRTLFGPATWDAYTPAEKNDRWHLIFRQIGQLTGSKGLEIAKKMGKYAKKHWHFDDQQVANLFKINIPKGVGNVSEKAISYILPYLKRGYLYDQAVLLGSIPKAFGHSFDQATATTNHWATLSQAEKEAIEEHAISCLSSETQKARDAIACLSSEAQKARDAIILYLKTNYPQKALYTERIYHHSHFGLPQRHDKLPMPNPTRNPIVDKALIQLRRVVNALMKKHHLTEIPCIRVEMARELKKSPKAKKRIEKAMKQNEREKKEAQQCLQRNHIPSNSYNLKKYRLWKEASYTCPFSMTKISLEQLYDKLPGGGSAVEIEHIRPVEPEDSRWINLTVAHRDANKNKNKRTPYEFFLKTNPKRWPLIKKNAQKCFPPAKYKHFISEEPLGKKPITQREANLTGYITRETKNYLQHISPNVQTTQGGVVSTLRHKHKLDQLLFLSFVCKQKGSELKINGDHVKEGAICYVAYTKANEGEVAPPFDGWHYISETTILPQYRMVGIAHFKPEFETRKIEEISQDINKCLKKFKALKQITDKAQKKAQEKALKSELSGYYSEKNDEEKYSNSQKNTLVKNLEKRVKAALGSGAAFHIIESRIAKKKNDKAKPSPLETYYLNPNIPKNRADHRHHLIDACVTAITRIQDTKRINEEEAKNKHRKDRHYNIPTPWGSFSEDVKVLLSHTLISREHTLKICAKAKKRVRIPRYDQGKQGKKYRYITAQGLTARGQLCKDTFFGQYTDQNGAHRYYVRKPITEIQTLKKAEKIVDKRIRELVKAHISRHKEGKVPYFFEQKEGNKITAKKPRLFLHKKGDQGNPTSPIKSVRIAENNSYMRRAKSNAINSWVNLKNNALAGFYYNKDDQKQPWTLEIATFWDSVQRVSQKKKPLPAHNEAGGTLQFTLKANDFMLFLPEEWQDNSLKDIQLLATAQLAPYLYRVQKFDQKGYFVFRKHMASMLDNPLEQLTLVCSSLLKRNPIKVSLNTLGQITNWQPISP